MKSVDHYCQFPGFGLSDTPFHSPRVGSVRNSTRMECQVALLYIVPAHEFAVDVVDHLIRIDVAVVIWSGYRSGVIVIKAGTKGAHHEVVPFKRLVNRRWLMDPTRDGFEIMN